MSKGVVILTGAGQIGMAIARRIGFSKKIVVGDKSMKNAETITGSFELGYSPAGEHPRYAPCLSDGEEVQRPATFMSR